MLEQFLNHIRSQSLCKPGDKILLAVSGGLDSMVMLQLFSDAGFQVGVAHCNFQLRSLQSDEDEVFVEKKCEQLKVPFFSKRFETEKYSRQNDLSIQMAARELRYAWFDELIHQKGFTFLATAHHLNDSIETMVLNWVHGSSLEGFTGIPVRNGYIIRPLLFATRNELEMFATEKSVKWREDASNQTDDYQRNFIRHQVLPKLREINPSLESTIQRGLKKIKGELLFLDDKVNEWKTMYCKLNGPNVSIDKKGLYGSAFSSGFLLKVIRPFGFNVDQCENILEALSGQPGKKFFSPTHQLTIDREHIIVSLQENPWVPVKIEKYTKEAILGSWKMDVQEAKPVPSEDPSIAVLDADQLSFPLNWRTWKAGDYFYPLGMEHKRKLSDFLIDKKVSVAEKHYVTVLESNGQIVWVVGHRIDNRFRLTADTRSALSFTIHPHFI